jgi:hypothetical protein
MASIAHDTAVAAPAPASTRPRPKARPRRRAAQRPRVLGGVVWIVVLATLLAGIVALNVALLQLNMQLEQANQRKAELRAGNIGLTGRLSSAGSAPQVASTASHRLGLVSAEPDQTTYIDLGARRRK